MKILWDLKILWETGSRRTKIQWDFVSQSEVWHVWLTFFLNLHLEYVHVDMNCIYTNKLCLN